MFLVCSSFLLICLGWTGKFLLAFLVHSSFSGEKLGKSRITPRLVLIWPFQGKLGNCPYHSSFALVGKCLGKLRKCSVLPLICFRRFMETRNFPIEFPVCFSFCLGGPGASRKILGVLPVYSSFAPAFSGQTREFSFSLLVSSWFPFDPLHFNQSQNLEVDDAKLHYNYCAFAELSRFVCCLLAPVFQMFRRNVWCQWVSSRY